MVSWLCPGTIYQLQMQLGGKGSSYSNIRHHGLPFATRSCLPQATCSQLSVLGTVPVSDSYELLWRLVLVQDSLMALLNHIFVHRVAVRCRVCWYSFLTKASLALLTHNIHHHWLPPDFLSNMHFCQSLHIYFCLAICVSEEPDKHNAYSIIYKSSLIDTFW